jgi:HAMP domain-containing protein/HPt (histidine-containing phosphotransfer) domain-containing protein
MVSKYCFESASVNIRHRIMLLVVLSFLAIALIGGFAVYQGRGSAKEVKTVTQGVVPSALASAELVGQLKDVQLSVMAIVSAADLKLAAQAEDRLQATQGRLQRAFDQQMAQADSEAQRGLVVQAKESLSNYFAAIKDTVGFKLKGQTDVAEANLAANVGGYLQEMEAVVETLQIEKRRSKDDAIAALNENLSGTTSTIAVVTVIAVLVLGGMGFLLYRQIIVPIAEMERKMTEIATSQDFSQRLPVQRMDEIGHSITAFNVMVEKIQEASELVKQKTADIHAMLHYIPQGILTVQADNRIHPEYSTFLENILETREIAGRSLMDVVFTGTGCNADQLSQIETVSSACIGEDEMNFGFNAHLLPSEISKTMFNGDTKILDLNWSPITDESGTTLRILLCVRDVTELRALAVEAQLQKRELNIIGEILAVHQEKFHEFTRGATAFLVENRALIEDTPVNSTFAERQPVITQLFRNMHTIKGNARTYGLLHLTHVVHEAEQTYDSLRASEDTVWDRDYLLQQLDATRVALEEYVHINEVKLGRKGPGRRGGVDNFLMVEKQHIAATLALLEHADAASGAAQRDALRQTRHSLELMGTQSFEEVLAGVLESLPALAKELGKEAPVTTIHSNGIMLRTQVAGLLKNVCMHLYRNAMDHGLEPATERVAHGKSPAGQVHMTVSMQGEHLAIKLQDDGRGLAVAHIRRKAIERKLIAEDAVLSGTEIAELVLKPGFSTAEKVTEVSGRGVGMDAVMGFVKAEGGSLRLTILDESSTQDYRPFETLILLPGKFAVAPALRLLQQSA